MSDRDFERQLKGWSLTTAEIMYRMPDYRSVLQTFIWQDYDIAPKFPVMARFIDYWREKLDGALHSIRYTHRKLVAANEWRKVDGEILLQ